MPEIQAFASAFDGRSLDASVLMLSEIGFLPAGDPRMRSTVEAIEQHLRRGDFVLRYDREDDFGIPSTAFIVCTFWLIQALALQGDRRRAREQFEKLLACRNRLGLLSEDIDINTGELSSNCSADLQHGRHHHVRDEIELALG